MKRAMRWAVPALGVAAVVVLFLVLRPDDEPAPAARGSPPPTVSPTDAVSPAETGSPTSTETETPEPDEHEIRVRVAGGEVSGPGEVEVPQGSRVEIEVEADVTDEVHVHGYDLRADVTPERRAKIRFRADATGVFEVELEGAGLLLLELRVVP